MMVSMWKLPPAATGLLGLLLSDMLERATEGVDGRLTYFAIGLIDYNLAGAGTLYGLGSHSHVRVTRPSASIGSSPCLPCSHRTGDLPETGTLLGTQDAFICPLDTSLAVIYEVNIISQDDILNGGTLPQTTAYGPYVQT